MKKITKRLCAAAILAVASMTAASETLTVQGKVTNPACTLLLEPVVFGDVPISALETGSPAEEYAKTFNVTVTSCMLSTLRSASLKFEGTRDPAYSTQYGLQTTPGAGAAQGVAINLVGDDEAHNMKGVQIRTDGGVSYPLTLSKSTLQMKAVYVPTGAALVPGTANSTVTVTLTYS